jgi:hypothetical protein
MRKECYVIKIVRVCRHRALQSVHVPACSLTQLCSRLTNITGSQVRMWILELNLKMGVTELCVCVCVCVRARWESGKTADCVISSYLLFLACKNSEVIRVGEKWPSFLFIMPQFVLCERKMHILRIMLEFRGGGLQEFLSWVKFALQQTIKAQRGSTDIVLLFL